MANIIEGTGNYGVVVKWSGGGTTTYYYQNDSTRNSNFKRIKKEVSKQDNVFKKNR